MMTSTMDRISNKFKLVRSQSIGVGMGGEGGKVVVRPEGRPAQIVLLDERRLELTVQPRLYAGELLDLVASQCGLKEKEYFGLAVVDEAGHYTWLQLDRKVLDHDLPRKPAMLTVHFLVKFFIESISHLADNQTVELFYLQARSLIWRGLLEVESDVVFQLAALGLQAAHGDYQDEAGTRSLLKKNTLLPSYVLKEEPSSTYCEDQVIQHYKKTAGQSRGQALVNYMTIVESMPTYGVHYFEVYDKRSTPWWIGLSCRGIAQYKHSDRKVPVRVFQWKQLENLYFRDKKFSIEVHDSKRVVQTLSSYNLYEDALKLDGQSSTAKDELVNAITDSTTQVSVSRRTFDPGHIHVCVWYAQTSALTKCIWQSAISQHQFYLDRKQARLRGQAAHRTLKEIARDLTRSSASLSSASSASNLSLTGSSHSLAVSGSFNSQEQENELTEDAKRAKAEMVAALKARREALEEKVREKRALLKEICIKEGELTGELPPEIPLAPGEPLPTIRRRIGTEFQISERLLNTAASPEEEQLAQLELELEIQSKITSAALKLANDTNARKNVRRQRKISYNQSQKKLQELEFKVASLKHSKNAQAKRAKQPRPVLPPGQRQEGRRASGGGAPLDRSGQQGTAEELLRRGKSVPDLGQGGRGEPGQDDEEEIETAQLLLLSPRSCPSSPRKQPLGLPHHELPVPLSAAQPRTARNLGGYIPSSVYLRSSYRTKQYPTLSTLGRQQPAGGPVRVVWGQQQQQDQHNHHTLPTPYKNRFEANSGCDSPVGLYNCPQQRTSQAFSSLDDLDGLAGMGPPPSRRPEAAPHYPSLERSARKKQKPATSLSTAAIIQAALRPESKSMESLELLENAGARGTTAGRARLRLHQQADKLAAREQALDDLVYRTGQTTLKNSEEYPSSTVGSTTVGGFDDVDGGGSSSYPALPLPARRTTLLPGQTYPEPLTSGTNILLAHSHTVSVLREAYSPPTAAASSSPRLSGGGGVASMATYQPVLPPHHPHHPHHHHHHHHHLLHHYNHTFTVHARKVETTLAPQQNHKEGGGGRLQPAIAGERGGSPGPTQLQDGEEVKPPLFPKQYYYSVKQRLSENSDSPAVPRKLKPNVSLSPSTSASMSPGQGGGGNSSLLRAPSPQSLNNECNSSFEAGNSSSGQSNAELGGHPTGFQPYRETTKPFEMADFYKYSTKFRKASASSLKSTESDSPHVPDSQPGSGSASQRSSTSRESVPPELPVKSSHGSTPNLAINTGPSAHNHHPPHHHYNSASGISLHGSPAAVAAGHGTVAAVPAIARLPAKGGGEEAESLADAFSTEMLAWYEQKQNGKVAGSGAPTGSGGGHAGKPATLV